MLKTNSQTKYFNLCELWHSLQQQNDPKQGSVQVMLNLYSVIWKIQSKQISPLKEGCEHVMNEIYDIVISYIKDIKVENQEFHITDIRDFTQFTDLIIIAGVEVTKKKKITKTYLNSRFQFLNGNKQLTPLEQLKVADPIIKQVSNIFFMIMKQTAPKREVKLPSQSPVYEQISFQQEIQQYECLETISLPAIISQFEQITYEIEEEHSVEIIEKVIYVQPEVDLDTFIFQIIQHFTKSINTQLKQETNYQQYLDFSGIVKQFVQLKKVKDSLLYCRNFIFHQDPNPIERKHFQKLLQNLHICSKHIEQECQIQITEQLTDFLKSQTPTHQQLIQSISH